MSAIIIESDIVHYEVLGRGRPLIFLHGWVGSWRYWIPAMQTTSTSFRAYALDLWGFGDSARSKDNYTLDRQIRLIARFLHELGIGKIGLVGHGLGAVVSLLFAHSYPQAVDRMMMISYPFEPGQMNNRLETSTPKDLAEWLLSGVPGSDAARAETPKTDPQSLRVSLEGTRQIDLFTQAVQPPIPTLFVHGKNDPAINLPAERHLTNLAEHAHQITFDESGHFPMLDQANKFNRLLADFLSLGSGESPRRLQLKEEWKRRVR